MFRVEGVKLVTFDPIIIKNRIPFLNEKFAYYFFIHKKVSKAGHWVLQPEHSFCNFFADFLGHVDPLSDINLWFTGQWGV